MDPVIGLIVDNMPLVAFLIYMIFKERRRDVNDKEREELLRESQIADKRKIAELELLVNTRILSLVESTSQVIAENNTVLRDVKSAFYNCRAYRERANGRESTKARAETDNLSP